LRKNEINYATATYYLMLRDETNANYWLAYLFVLLKKKLDYIILIILIIINSFLIFNFSILFSKVN
jgi:hypothetical protein